jgi:hypothetical protein
MSRKKVIRFRVSNGPVQVDTDFILDSPEGYGAWYLKQGEIEPRRGVALGLRILFAPLGAAMMGQSLEQVETLILSSERYFEDFMRQAREQAQCNRRSSPENLMTNPEEPKTNEKSSEESRNGLSNSIDGSSNAMDDLPPHGLLVDPNEDLSNLFN